MEASKLQISPSTLRFERMTKGKRAELRRKNIISLIRSTPVGTPISLAEFQAVTQHTTVASTYALLKGMEKKKLIARTSEGPKQYSYAVLGDTNIVKPKVEVFTPDISNITDMAKEYAWTYNDDSLRGFIKWLGSAK